MVRFGVAGRECATQFHNLFHPRRSSIRSTLTAPFFEGFKFQLRSRWLRVALVVKFGAARRECAAQFFNLFHPRRSPIRSTLTLTSFRRFQVSAQGVVFASCACGEVWSGGEGVCNTIPQFIPPVPLANSIHTHSSVFEGFEFQLRSSWLRFARVW